VVPIYEEYPTQGFETLVDPEDKESSPYGWLSTDGVTFNTTTTGNNAYAFNVTAAPQTAPDEFVYNYEARILIDPAQPGAHPLQFTGWRRPPDLHPEERCDCQRLLRREHHTRHHLQVRLHRGDLQLPADEYQGRWPWQ
jgi:hypothetical protein